MVREGDPTENQMVVFSPAPSLKFTREPIDPLKNLHKASIFGSGADSRREDGITISRKQDDNISIPVL